eukprot:scaffold13181_cov109-Isochrysis_galbana.AAC.1
MSGSRSIFQSWPTELRGEGSGRLKFKLWGPSRLIEYGEGGVNALAEEVSWGVRRSCMPGPSRRGTCKRRDAGGGGKEGPVSGYVQKLGGGRGRRCKNKRGLRGSTWPASERKGASSTSRPRRLSLLRA